MVYLFVSQHRSDVTLAVASVPVEYLAKNRDLAAGEIVEQIMNVQHHLDEKGQDERVSHVVVMGIGEPFDNFDNLINFLTVIKNQKGLSIGARHITVSTSGLSPKFMNLLI